MTIHYLNCFTCNARWPKSWQTGTLCLLVETEHGLVLVDTGLGQQDYIHPTAIIRLFQFVTIMPFDPHEAALHQIVRLGYKPHDVRHIVLTHMHFDHCGGLPDFPQAQVHLNQREYQAFMGRKTAFQELAYNRRNIHHQPRFKLYQPAGEMWFDFAAMRLEGIHSEMWLVPLYGHTRGHCGVAIQTEAGWHFHLGDAAPDLSKDIPAWTVKLVLGPHLDRLRAFGAAHPDVNLTSSHMFLDFFADQIHH